MAPTRTQMEAMFQHFRPLADAIARDFARKSHPILEFDDARQVAQMQLWLSCGSVEPCACAGSGAAAYLRRCIRGALLHHLRDHGRMVRVSRREHEKGTHAWRHSSLHQPTPSGDLWINQLPSPEQAHGQAQEQEQGQGQGDEQALQQLLDRLPASQAAVIRLSVLEGRSLRQIGAQLGMSAMAVQRRRQAALASLKAQLI